MIYNSLKYLILICIGIILFKLFNYIESLNISGRPGEWFIVRDTDTDGTQQYMPIKWEGDLEKGKLLENLSKLTDVYIYDNGFVTMNRQFDKQKDKATSTVEILHCFIQQWLNKRPGFDDYDEVTRGISNLQKQIRLQEELKRTNPELFEDEEEEESYSDLFEDFDYDYEWDERDGGGAGGGGCAGGACAAPPT